MFRLIMTTAVTVSIAGSCFAQSDTDTQMRNLTSSVLAGLNGTAPQSPELAKTEPASLKVLVEQALSAGQSDAYLEALVDEAVDKGQVAVPDAMRTTDGAVDTRTLLASIIAKSEGAQPTATTAALVSEAEGPKEDRFHKVLRGDSLAAISLKYYGEAQGYTRIFEANRDRLSSPNRIIVGQTLLIPG